MLPTLCLRVCMLGLCGYYGSWKARMPEQQNHGNKVSKFTII